jgi:hypothetical protein
VRDLRIGLVAFGALAVTAAALPQALPEFVSATGEHPLAGWEAFTEVGFLLNALFTLTLAAALGAAIGYHPRLISAADTLEDIRAPKVYTMYAVIGATIGLMVLQFGMVIGFIVFGIGGLIRFRTDLRSASVTGQVILVTLIGLSCGLNLPHVAVLATVFGFVLIQIRDSRVTYRVDVQGVPAERLAAVAAAYRAVLLEQGCRVMNEKRSPSKQRVTFIFHCPRRVTRQHLEQRFDTQVEPASRGTLDWEID